MTPDKPNYNGYGLVMSKALMGKELDEWYWAFAEIEPAASRWLPWPGRMSRWWYEITIYKDPNDVPFTFAYDGEGGSGGGFTLRKCMNRALEALETYETKAMEGTLWT